MTQPASIPGLNNILSPLCSEFPKLGFTPNKLTQAQRQLPSGGVIGALPTLCGSTLVVPHRNREAHCHCNVSMYHR